MFMSRVGAEVHVRIRVHAHGAYSCMYIFKYMFIYMFQFHFQVHVNAHEYEQLHDHVLQHVVNIAFCAGQYPCPCQNKSRFLKNTHYAEKTVYFI